MHDACGCVTASEVEFFYDGAAGLFGGRGVYRAVRASQPHVVRVLVLAIACAVAEGRAEGVDGPVAGRLVAGPQASVVFLTLARVPVGGGRRRVSGQRKAQRREGKRISRPCSTAWDNTYLGFLAAESCCTLPALKAGLNSEGPWNFLGGWSIARTSQARQFLDLT